MKYAKGQILLGICYMTLALAFSAVAIVTFRLAPYDHSHMETLVLLQDELGYSAIWIEVNIAMSLLIGAVLLFVAISRRIWVALVISALILVLFDTVPIGMSTYGLLTARQEVDATGTIVMFMIHVYLMLHLFRLYKG